MEAAGLGVVQMGKLAWSRLEPQKGRYDFEWLRRAIRLAGRHRLSVVLGSPLEHPPAWLLAPMRAQQGSSWSAEYQDRGAMLLGRLAQALKQERPILGWQLSTPRPPSPSDPDIRPALATWLRHRYSTPTALAKAWGLPSGGWGDWNALLRGPLPTRIGGRDDWQRFASDAMQAWQHTQIHALRVHLPQARIIASAEDGESWEGSPPHEPDRITWTPMLDEAHRLRLAIRSDEIRGRKQRAFWVSEEMPSSQSMREPQALRLLAWELLGHGADGVMLWPARAPARAADTGFLRLAGELRKIAQDLRQVGPALRGTKPWARVAVLVGPESAMGPWRHCPGSSDPEQVLLHFYRPLRQLSDALDVRSPSASLSRYRVVVAPALGAISAAQARRLTAYVRHGGHLLLGPWSTLTGEAGKHLPLGLLLKGSPGECHGLPRPLRIEGATGSGFAGQWAEGLPVANSTIRVLLRYGESDSPLAGRPAALTLRYGRGTVSYLGTMPDPALMSGLLQPLLSKAGALSRFGPLPPDVQRLVRVGKHQQILILINHGQTARSMLLPERMRVLAGSQHGRQVNLPARDVVVLEAGQTLP